MKYNFDEFIDRRGTSAVKLEAMKEIWGRDDLLPFAACPDIFASLMAPISEGVRGVFKLFAADGADPIVVFRIIGNPVRVFAVIASHVLRIGQNRSRKTVRRKICDRIHFSHDRDDSRVRENVRILRRDGDERTVFARR